MSSLTIFPNWGSAQKANTSVVILYDRARYICQLLICLWSIWLCFSLTACLNWTNVFCFLSSSSLLPPATTADFGSYLSLLWTNTASLVRACLIIWWERFRGCQKEDDCGPLSIQSSLACLYTVKKLAIFPCLAGTSLTKLSLAGDN